MFQNFAWFINGRFGAVSRYKDGKHALVYLIKHYQMLLTVRVVVVVVSVCVCVCVFRFVFGGWVAFPVSIVCLKEVCV